MYTEHREWTLSFYAESRYADHPFWRMRRAPLRGAPASSRPLRRHPWRPPLASPSLPHVTLTDIPCIVGNFIESRRGVTGPSRPFVWLGGVEAATLLQPLPGRELPRETLIAQWQRITPHAASLFDRLLRRGVIFDAARARP